MSRGLAFCAEDGGTILANEHTGYLIMERTDGRRRSTTRDVDQCFVAAEGIVHYRLHETSPGNFVLNYITEGEHDPKPALCAAVQKIESLLQPAKKIEIQSAKFLLPEGRLRRGVSGLFHRRKFTPHEGHP